VLISDPTREFRAFRVAQSAPAGSKRGTGRGAFIDSLISAVDEFYEQVVQGLKPWIAAAPKLRSDNGQAEPVLPSLVSTAISSQDGSEPITSDPASAPAPPGGEVRSDRSDRGQAHSVEATSAAGGRGATTTEPSHPATA
jgi:hypothetical protein